MKKLVKRASGETLLFAVAIINILWVFGRGIGEAAVDAWKSTWDEWQIYRCELNYRKEFEGYYSSVRIYGKGK